MNEKDVLKKLNVLKNIKPSAEWKLSARDVLSSQVSNSSEAVKISILDGFVFEVKNSLSFFAQPVFAVLGLFLLVAGGSFAANAARNTKPGDSFYAARVWGQKARVAVVLDRQAKAKMEMKYASARAKEITDVLTDPSFNLEDNGNQKKADKLVENLKAEIKTVSDRYEEINKKVEVALVSEVDSSIASSNINVDDNVAVAIGRSTGDDKMVFAVDSSKASSGIQISQPSLVKTENNVIPAAAALVVEPLATSTDSDFKKNLSDAADLVDSKDFAGAKDILDQVDIMIGKIEQVESVATPIATTAIDNIVTEPASSSQEKE
jgi:hypothetical protein